MLHNKKNKERVILHCDMNNFYASVECMLNPSLSDKAIAVAGSVEERTGIILAKNNLAKSQGVVTAETIWQAKKKCPDLVVVSPNFEEYLKYSRLAREIYERFTDQVEPFGLDEAFLDVTGSKILGNGLEIAEQIRQAIKTELGLTISTGVSFNKIFAKLGSDMKKPDAITCIEKDSYKEKIWSLPASELLGVGRSTKKNLNKYGILTIGDLANANDEFLAKIFGKQGEILKKYANGQDNSEVKSTEVISDAKSIGHGITTVKDLVNNPEVWCVILELSQSVSSKLRTHQKKTRGISIGVRNSELQNKIFQAKLEFPTQSAMVIAKNCYELFKEKYIWEHDVRSVTITAINLISEDVPLQYDLFTDVNSIKKREKLDNAIEDIRKKYGKKSVVNAVLLTDKKLPDNIEDISVLPNNFN